MHNHMTLTLRDVARNFANWGFEIIACFKFKL
jgi:hypothetical protein